MDKQLIWLWCKCGALVEIATQDAERMCGDCWGKLDPHLGG